MQKSSIYFSPNCGDPVRTEVRNILQIDREALTEKYLGLPTSTGRITDHHFEHLVERSRSCVQGYCDKKMSSELLKKSS
jgi:hypothetical protein